MSDFEMDELIRFGPGSNRAADSRLDIADGMRYQRAELPLKLDGLACRARFLRRLLGRRRSDARKPVGRPCR